MLNKTIGWAIALTVVIPSVAMSYQGVMERFELYRTPGDWWGINWAYHIEGTLDDDPSMSQPINACRGEQGCVFGPVIRTGLGQMGKLCDAGGVCTPGWMLFESPSVSLPSGATWGEAYGTWIKKYGRGGDRRIPKYAFDSSIRDPDWAWGSLCGGYGALPLGTFTSSELAPRSNCLVAPDPLATCTFQIPSHIDLGTVKQGATGVSGAANGSVQCDSVTTVMGRLRNVPRLAGNSVAISINNKLMGDNGTTVGTGTLVPLNIKAEIRGALLTPGVHSADVILQLTYP